VPGARSPSLVDDGDDELVRAADFVDDRIRKPTHVVSPYLAPRDGRLGEAERLRGRLDRRQSLFDGVEEIVPEAPRCPS
jgi:hypothetical protein